MLGENIGDRGPIDSRCGVTVVEEQRLSFASDLIPKSRVIDGCKGHVSALFLLNQMRLRRRKSMQGGGTWDALRRLEIVTRQRRVVPDLTRAVERRNRRIA